LKETYTAWRRVSKPWSAGQGDNHSRGRAHRHCADDTVLPREIVVGSMVTAPTNHHVTITTSDDKQIRSKVVHTQSLHLHSSRDAYNH
jgi:hypothetical protein